MIHNFGINVKKKLHFPWKNFGIGVIPVFHSSLKVDKLYNSSIEGYFFIDFIDALR